METSLHSTVVGVFNDRATAEQTVQALEDAGFEHDQIWYSSPGGASRFFEDIKSLFTGSSTTDENLVNQLSAMGLSDEEASSYADTYNSGHAVVAVKAPGREEEARDLFHSHGASSYNTTPQSSTRASDYNTMTDSSPDASDYSATADSSTDTTSMDSTAQHPFYSQYDTDSASSSADTAPATDATETESAAPVSQDPMYVSPPAYESFAAIYTSGDSPEGRYPQEDTMIAPSEATADQYSSQENSSATTDAMPVDYTSPSTPEAENEGTSYVEEMEMPTSANYATPSPAEDTETARPFTPANYTTPSVAETASAQAASTLATPINYESRMQDLQQQIQETQQQLEEARVRLQAAKEHESRFRDAQKQLQDMRDQLSATLDELRRIEENMAQLS